MQKTYDIKELRQSGRYYTAIHTISDNIAHVHRFWELACQIKGESENTVNGKTVTLYVGDILIMKPGDQHRVVYKKNACVRDLYVSDERMKKILSVFNSDLYASFTESNEPVVFSLDANIVNTIEEELIVFELSAQSNEELDDIQSSVLTYIFGNYVKNKMYRHDPLPDWMKKLIQTLNTDELSSKKVNEIIQTTNYSYGHVAREFKKYTGVTLKEYVNKIKLERAATMLVSSKDAIYAIGEKIGFESTNGFIRAFSETYGITPNKYRQIRTQKH